VLATEAAAIRRPFRQPEGREERGGEAAQGSRLAPALRRLRDEVREIAARLPRPSVVSDAEGDVKVVERLRGALASPVRQELLSRVDDAMARINESTERHRARLSFDLLRFLEGGSRLRAALQSGHNLRSFLAGAVSQASGAVDLVVTGHSKGGALARGHAGRGPCKPGRTLGPRAQGDNPMLRLCRADRGQRRLRRTLGRRYRAVLPLHTERQGHCAVRLGGRGYPAHSQVIYGTRTSDPRSR